MMPTIEELREAFPALSDDHEFWDRTIASPHFHIGVLSSYLDNPKLRLSLAVIEDALKEPR